MLSYQIVATLRNLTTGLAKVARVHAPIPRLKIIQNGKDTKGAKRMLTIVTVLHHHAQPHTATDHGYIK